MIAALVAWPAWVPFATPAPIWGAWPWLLLPLLLGISVSYKAVKVATPRRLAIESIALTAYLLVGLIAAAIVLALFVGWAL